MAMTVLAATGTFAAYTYITPFLTEVSRFPAAATGPLLLVRGVAGIAVAHECRVTSARARSSRGCAFV